MDAKKLCLMVLSLSCFSLGMAEIGKCLNTSIWTIGIWSLHWYGGVGAGQ